MPRCVPAPSQAVVSTQRNLHHKQVRGDRTSAAANARLGSGFKEREENIFHCRNKRPETKPTWQ